MKFIYLSVLFGVFVFYGSALCAKEHISKEQLIERIIIGGTTESKAARHTITVSGCVITTYVYKPYNEEKPWPLWSSFVFDLSVTNIGTANKKKMTNYIILKNINKGALKPHGAIVLFDMVAPNVAIHEVPNFRKHKNAIGKSPRKGADGYVYVESKRFFILNEGLINESLPELFTRSINQYKKEYCTLLG